MENVHFDIKWFDDILQEQFKTQFSNSKSCFAAVHAYNWETTDMFNKQVYFNILKCTNIRKTETF